jgi:hypothetical protein
MKRNIPTITINNPNKPINISVPNTSGGSSGNPFVNWTGNTSNFGNTGNPTTNISTFNPPNINIPNNIPTGNTQSFGNNVDQNSTQVITRYQNLMKGFTGQVLGGVSHDKRHCRDYSEKPQVNKEMLAAARGIDSKNNAKAVNFILFHDCYLNDDDMYWLSSIFNTHTPKGLAVNTVDLSNNCLRLEEDYNLPFFSFKPYNQVRIIGRLDLSNNNIGDYGAKVVADALENGVLPNTKHIDVSGNKITQTGWEYFSTSVKKLKAKTVAIKVAAAESLQDMKDFLNKGFKYYTQNHTPVATKEFQDELLKVNISACQKTKNNMKEAFITGAAISSLSTGNDILIFLAGAEAGAGALLNPDTFDCYKEIMGDLQNWLNE